MKILMVCLGNICRSPLAEGILKQMAHDRGLNWEVQSAGTGDWHIGQAPDKRSIAAAKRHGFDISKQRAQQFSIAHFEYFDHIFVMDPQNYKDVANLATHIDHLNKVRLFIPDGKVQDPYWDDHLFDSVCLQVIERCDTLIDQLRLT